MPHAETHNFFEEAGFDWNTYIVHRPAPTPSFYETIYSHHRANNGAFNLAHDIGTGPGNIAEQIGKTFKKVHASDPSKYHSGIAGKRLNAIDAEKYSAQQCRGEDISEESAGHTPGSVDLITVAQCIPIMDADAAISGFAKLLKPNGTLAIWFYGRPIFADPAQQQSQEIYNKILSKAWDRIRPMEGTQYAPASVTLSAFLDNIAIPDDKYKQIRRLKWNDDKPMMFIDDDDMGFEVKWDSKVGANESIERKIDRTFWENDADSTWMRGLLENLLPWPKSEEEDIKLEGLFRELETSMGGKDVKQKIGWPVVLLLASKK